MVIALEAGRPFIFFGLNRIIRHDLLSTIVLNSVISSETAKNDKETFSRPLNQKKPQS